MRGTRTKASPTEGARRGTGSELRRGSEPPLEGTADLTVMKECALKVSRGAAGFVKPLAAVGTKVMLGVSGTAMSRRIHVCDDSAYQFA